MIVKENIVKMLIPGYQILRGTGKSLEKDQLDSSTNLVEDWKFERYIESKKKFYWFHTALGPDPDDKRYCDLPRPHKFTQMKSRGKEFYYILYRVKRLAPGCNLAAYMASCTPLCIGLSWRRYPMFTSNPQAVVTNIT